jgi:hypothetical protein
MQDHHLPGLGEEAPYFARAEFEIERGFGVDPFDGVTG